MWEPHRHLPTAGRQPPALLPPIPEATNAVLHLRNPIPESRPPITAPEPPQPTARRIVHRHGLLPLVPEAAELRCDPLPHAAPLLLLKPILRLHAARVLRRGATVRQAPLRAAPAAVAPVAGRGVPQAAPARPEAVAAEDKRELLVL